MHIIRGVDFHLKNSAVSLGKFDGLHRGHRLLLQKIMSVETLCPTVFTFDGIFPGERIYTGREQSLVLERLGMSREILFPFCKETKAMTAEQFVGEILSERLGAGLVCVGEDFRFGRDRLGDVELLAEMSERYGYELCVYPKLQDEGGIISSTRIREELAQGNIREANKMLGSSYFISGEVTHGRAFGRTMGMPTANIIPDREKLLPVYGVYVTRVEVDGQIYGGVTNIGRKPTVGGSDVGVETTLLDFEGNLYDKNILVYFEDFLRPEKKFSDIDALKKQIYQDRERAAKLLSC